MGVQISFQEAFGFNAVSHVFLNKAQVTHPREVSPSAWWYPAFGITNHVHGDLFREKEVCFVEIWPWVRCFFDVSSFQVFEKYAGESNMPKFEGGTFLMPTHPSTRPYFLWGGGIVHSVDMKICCQKQ